MELKEYQVRALEAFERWREALATARKESDLAIAAWPKAAGEIPDAVRNYPSTAWRKLADSGGVANKDVPYIDRTADAGYPIPHVCFKVPTGGGKTLLAAAALERLKPTNRFSCSGSSLRVQSTSRPKTHSGIVSIHTGRC